MTEPPPLLNGHSTRPNDHVAQVVNGQRVWLPAGTVPNSAQVPQPSATPIRIDPAPLPQPNPAARPAPADPGLVVSIGGPGRQLSAATGIERADVAWPAAEASVATKPDELPDGVLPPAGKLMSGLIGTIGGIAAIEAAFNIFKFTEMVLHLPTELAMAFPVIFEAAASSFALQDLRDRRRGVESRLMKRAAYALLILSASVGAMVGVLMYGPFGVLAGLASLVLGVMIHVHGERATMAYRTRARLSKTWRAEQQRAAETESARDVLPLLLPSDEHGKATAALLNRRMDAGTLTPGDALIAAGWHQRNDRGLSDSQVLRLEVVAATIWGNAVPPAPERLNRPSASSGSGSGRGTKSRGTSDGRGSSGGSTGGSSAGSARGTKGGSSAGSARGTKGGSSAGSAGGTSDASASGSSVRSTARVGKRTVQELRLRSFEDLLSELDDAIADGQLSRESSTRAIRNVLRVSAPRSEALHAHLQGAGTATTDAE